MKDIRSFWQSINYVWFFCTDPLFYDVALFIDDLKLRAFQFFPGCCIGFRKLALSRLVFHLFCQLDFCKVLICVRGIHLPDFFIWKISRFSHFLFYIIFPMVEVAVKSKLSVLIGCFFLQQHILFYKNLTLLGQNIFFCVQSENHAFQFFFCDCIFFLYRNGNLLSFIFIGNAFINDSLRIILCSQGKFLLFRVQYEMVACHRFFQIIRTQWKIVHYCFSFFICDQGCY